MSHKLGLQTRLFLLMLLAAALPCLAYALIFLSPVARFAAALPAAGSVASWACSVALALPFQYLLAQRFLAHFKALLRAVEGQVLSYAEGDFGRSIVAPSAFVAPELSQFQAAHVALGLALHGQRQQLAQRELLLDSVVQHTPMALLLVDEAGVISYANLAARQFLGEGKTLLSQRLVDVLASAPAALREALGSGSDQLFSLPAGGQIGHGRPGEQEEQFHFSQRPLTLLGQPHRLLLLRRMTQELSRQEVASWKRVIRVISHELNNSLAPISSLAHSGAELARRGELTRVGPVFQSIGQRATHLHAFLAGYAQFAKLPPPQTAEVAWPTFLEGLARHCQFSVQGGLPPQPGVFDCGQIEQALINLIKNAHEAGGPAEAVSLGVNLQPSLDDMPPKLYLSVADRGPGMSDAVLAQALLPFYSTKRRDAGGTGSGQGLGLALAREIAEAHGGHITLARREGGGMTVSLCLPQARG